MPNLERRYRETDSLTVREELAKYLGIAALPRLRRHAPQSRGAQRVRRRARAARARASHAWAKRSTFFSGARRSPGWRGEVADKIVKEVGDRLRFLVDVGPRLPHARPQRRIALGRRGAAHPAREPGRLGPHRRDVHPRRAVDRPAPARQRPAARHAQAPARPRQHRDRRRARRGRDPRRRSRHRHGPGAGVHGGQVVAQGTPEEIEASAALAHRPVPVGRQAQDRRCRALRTHARSEDACCASSARRGNNLQATSTLRDPARPARPASPASRARASRRSSTTRCSLRGRRTLNGTLLEPGAASSESKGSSTSTASSTSTRARSAARRARTRRRTPACSRRSASCSPRVPEARARGYDAGPLQLQRQGRPLRGLPGRRPHQGRDALPARRLRALRRLQRPALQPRDARDPLQAARTSTKCSR